MWSFDEDEEIRITRLKANKNHINFNFEFNKRFKISRIKLKGIGFIRLNRQANGDFPSAFERISSAKHACQNHVLIIF